MSATIQIHTPITTTLNSLGDRVFWSLIIGLTGLSTLIMFLIVGFLLAESWVFIKSVGPYHFLIDEGWWPLEQAYNLMPMVVASISVTLGALIVATPLSIAFSVFCVFYARDWMVALLERFVEISAAIPSVIYGFWGLVVLVPLINQIHAPGASLIAGIIVLAMMIFPTITILTIAAIKAVPYSLIQGASALGVKRTSQIFKVILPIAKPGIVASMILGATRAIGETMVVLMVCGNVVQIPSSLFDPVRTLTANIALEMPYAVGDHRSVLFVTGLLVLIVVMIAVLMSEIYAFKKLCIKRS